MKKSLITLACLLVLAALYYVSQSANNYGQPDPRKWDTASKNLTTVFVVAFFVMLCFGLLLLGPKKENDGEFD